MAELAPSTVDVVVKWAKANSAISALVGTNVSTSLPANATWPWIQVLRVIGFSTIPEAPMDSARIQFNVWGDVKANGLPDWGPADLVLRTLEAEVRGFKQAVVDSSVIESMSTLEGAQQVEDPDTGQARFWVDVLVQVRNL